MLEGRRCCPGLQVSFFLSNAILGSNSERADACRYWYKTQHNCWVTGRYVGGCGSKSSQEHPVMAVSFHDSFICRWQRTLLLGVRSNTWIIAAWIPFSQESLVSPMIWRQWRETDGTMQWDDFARYKVVRFNYVSYLEALP